MTSVLTSHESIVSTLPTLGGLLELLLVLPPVQLLLALQRSQGTLREITLAVLQLLPLVLLPKLAAPVPELATEREPEPELEPELEKLALALLLASHLHSDSPKCAPMRDLRHCARGGNSCGGGAVAGGLLLQDWCWFW